MTSVLHILTAVTRPANLPAIAESLHPLAAYDIRVVWHLSPDTGQQHVGGQAIKNALIDTITDGWIWVCDDDNAVHPAFAATIAAMLTGSAGIVLLDQALPDGTVRRATPDAMRVDGVDIAQLVIRRDVLADHRIPETYAGDGLLIERLYQECPNQFFFTGVTACTYNHLRSS